MLTLVDARSGLANPSACLVYALLFEVAASTLEFSLKRFNFPTFILQSLACPFERLATVGGVLNKERIGIIATARTGKQAHLEISVEQSQFFLCTCGFVSRFLKRLLSRQVLEL